MVARETRGKSKVHERNHPRRCHAGGGGHAPPSSVPRATNSGRISVPASILPAVRPGPNRLQGDRSVVVTGHR